MNKYIEGAVLLMTQDNLTRLQPYSNETPDFITVPLFNQKNISYCEGLDSDTPAFTKSKKYKFAGMIRVYKELVDDEM